MTIFKSINFKISLVFILVITALILISNWSLYTVFSNIIVTRTIEDQANIMLQNKTNIENLANGINQATAYLYSNKTIADILDRNTNDKLENILDKSILSDQFDNFTNMPIHSSLDNYHAVMFLFDGFRMTNELDSYVIDENTFSKNRISNTAKVKDQTWFKAAEQANGALYTFTLDQSDSRIYVARLIKNKYISKPNYVDIVGIVVVGINKEYFSSYIEASRLTESSQMFLINDDHQVIYSNNKEAAGRQVTDYGVSPLRLEGKFGEPFDLKNEHGDNISTVYSLQWGWKVITMIPRSDILKNLGVIKKIIVLTTALGIFIGCGITILLSKQISQPIIKLARAMRDVREIRNIDVIMKPTVKDEIGVLYNSFNSMMKRINQLMDDLFESTNMQKNAELKMLQAQINPHFIYNTLDAINWMAMSKNVEEVITMVSSLANILRYSIKNPDDKVQLNEEIAHVANYASIQSIRYGNFDVMYEIDPSMMNMKVPKFIIQPLVENAIVHGISKIKEQGEIQIVGRHFDGVVEIVVSDNGPGTDARLLNEYLGGTVDVLRDSDGFGIQNINERIKMNYGDRYGLAYSNNEEGQLIAIIILPGESIE